MSATSITILRQSDGVTKTSVKLLVPANSNERVRIATHNGHTHGPFEPTVSRGQCILLLPIALVVAAAILAESIALAPVVARTLVLLDALMVL